LNTNEVEQVVSIDKEIEDAINAKYALDEDYGE